MKKLGLLLLTILVAGTLSSCNNNPEESIFDVVPETKDHYYSDRLTFDDMNISIEGKTFLQDKIEKVDLKYVTDGDTAVFHISPTGIQDKYTNVLEKEHSYVTIRFLGIDTPESTSAIAPWGKKASDYAKGLLENAEGIILDATSIDTSKYTNVYDTFKAKVRLDNNGTRWLAVVWYCPEGQDAANLKNYRCFTLDMIEECYSFYTGNIGDTAWCYQANEKTEPKLYSRHKDNYGSLMLNDVIFEAEIRAKSLGQGFLGAENDPDYDYSKKPEYITVKQAIEGFDDYVKTNRLVALTGVILRMIGPNFYIQDNEGYSIYVYMGINGTSIGDLFEVGDTISIRGRLSSYGGQKQLTDILFAPETFQEITDEGKKISLPEPITVDTTTLNTTLLEQHLGKLVTMRVNVSKSKKTEANFSKNRSYTVYTSNKITDLVGKTSYDTLSIRIDGALVPAYSLDEINGEGEYEGLGIINKTVDVTGILSIYLELDHRAGESYPSYQIMMTNKIMQNNSYVSDFVIVE